MKILNAARIAAEKAAETLEDLGEAAGDARNAMAVQTAVLYLVGIGVVVAIGLGIAALNAREIRTPVAV